MDLVSRVWNRRILVVPACYGNYVMGCGFERFFTIRENIGRYFTEKMWCFKKDKQVGLSE